MPKVLFVGQTPETVDFADPALPPGFDAEKIRAGIAVAMAAMAEKGWAGVECMIAPDDSGIADLKSRLAAESFECVVVGGGIRVPPKSLLFFETVINTIIAVAHRTPIAFNTKPQDTAEAAARVMGAG